MDKYLYELQRIEKNCDMKRKFLAELAHRREKSRKRLYVAAGVMALLAGFTSSAIFLEYTGSNIVKLIAALLTFCSAVVNLFASTYLGGNEIEDMFKGSSEFLKLRGDVAVTMISQTDEAKLRQALAKHTNEYALVSGKFDRYYEGFPSLLSGDRGLTDRFPTWPASSLKDRRTIISD